MESSQTSETVTPQPVGIVPPVVPSAQNLPKKKMPRIIGVVVVLLLLIAGAAFAFKYVQEPAIAPEMPIQTPKEEVSESIDTWEMYTNAQLGVRFYYPRRFPGSDPSRTADFQVFDEDLGNVGIGVGDRVPFYVERLEDITAQNYYQMHKSDNTEPLTSTFFKNAPAFEYIEPSDIADQRFLLIEKSKYLYRIHLHPDNDPENLSNKILSTFQFIDENGLLASEYKNLEFKYPSAWNFETPENNDEKTLKIGKDDHFIISSRRDIGGSQCVYSDTKTEDILPWAEGVKPISDFTELSFGSRVFRRSKIITSSGFFTEKEKNRTVFSFCQKEPSGVFGSFAFGETFYYDVPENYDENLLKEMDDIVLSAKEISKAEFCGGIAGILCPEGYRCQLDGNYPDAGGTCQK